jgi:hypothetical protein
MYQMRLQAQPGLLPWRKTQAIVHTGHRFNPQKTHRFAAAHAQQWPTPRMPDGGIEAVSRVDAQTSLPGRILQFQPTGMIEDPLTAAQNA